MAKEEKLKIFELFKKGVTVPELEKTSTVNRRTLYRWFKEYQASCEQKEDLQPISETVKEIKSQIEVQLDGINFQDDWVNVATAQSVKHCIVNGQIAEELASILLNEIKQPEINYRAVSALSSSINVHSRLHREYGMFYMLDVNKAIKMVESEGYIIQNPADEPIPIDKSDLAGMSSEQLASEYKKLISAS
jgi:hypothetical protein